MAKFDPRRAKAAGQVVRYVQLDGKERTLTAEDAGDGYAVFRPQTQDDDDILASHGFSRARKVIEAEKAKENN